MAFCPTVFSGRGQSQLSMFVSKRNPNVVSSMGCSARIKRLFELRRSTSTNQSVLGDVRMVFTGLVEEMGLVIGIDSGSLAEGVTLKVESKTCSEGIEIGDSISVNGACLSVISKEGSSLSFSVVPETIRRTNLGLLKPGHHVNLERSLSALGRFGGHVVQGHVDCTGRILQKWSEQEALWFRIEIPDIFMKYIVEKGYVAVDGTSLTVCDVEKNSFTFTMIPITQASVVTAEKIAGDAVNIECDITGKYIERMMRFRAS